MALFFYLIFCTLLFFITFFVVIVLTQNTLTNKNSQINFKIVLGFSRVKGKFKNFC